MSLQVPNEIAGSSKDIKKKHYGYALKFVTKNKGNKSVAYQSQQTRTGAMSRRGPWPNLARGRRPAGRFLLSACAMQSHCTHDASWFCGLSYVTMLFLLLPNLCRSKDNARLKGNGQIIYMCFCKIGNVTCVLSNSYK